MLLHCPLFPLTPFLSLSPVLSYSHSLLLLQHLLFISFLWLLLLISLRRGEWLWLQQQTLCMLKKDNNLQLVRLIVNFSVLMHLRWPYLCAATRNVNEFPLLYAQNQSTTAPAFIQPVYILEIIYRADEQLTMKTSGLLRSAHRQ